MQHLNRGAEQDPTYAIPYKPEKRERHKWEEQFSNIPTTVTSRKTRRGVVWSAGEGSLYLPQTAARIAHHAELIGMVYDPELAQMRRAQLASGVHVWVDKSVTLPTELDRVDATAAALADKMPADERRALAERLLEGIDNE
ncbi:hypothetical protein [Gordonia sp. MMO-8]|uniref:hypothetical protein n=1 Tax=Gordonia sp. MMO-8 TaxID=3127886 RepID=UPI00301B36E6